MLEYKERDTRQADFSYGIEELALPLIHVGAPTKG
jgi:hypothetical protein